MRQLNQEKQSIIKQIVLWKMYNPGKRFYLFITRGASTGNTFTAQALYHALVRIYNKDLQSDPLKKKGLILVFTGKAAYIAHGVILHSTLHLPLSPCHMVPFASNTFDVFRKKV